MYVCVLSCVEGQVILVPGTLCSDTVCTCRHQDGYKVDGDFCVKEPECREGEEMLLQGVFQHAVCACVTVSLHGVWRRQPRCRTGLATLPSVGAVPILV